MIKGLQQQQKENYNTPHQHQQNIMEHSNFSFLTNTTRGIQNHSATHYHNVILFAQTKLDLVNEIV